jgi:hypothetical protein
MNIEDIIRAYNQVNGTTLVPVKSNKRLLITNIKRFRLDLVDAKTNTVVYRAEEHALLDQDELLASKALIYLFNTLKNKGD